MKRRKNSLSLQGNWKKLWNMNVVFIPIVIGALDRVTKGLIKGLDDLEIRGWLETIQTTVLLWSVRMLRRAQETCDDCVHSNSCEKLSADTSVKNSQMGWIIVIEEICCRSNFGERPSANADVKNSRLNG